MNDLTAAGMALVSIGLVTFGALLGLALRRR